MLFAIHPGKTEVIYVQDGQSNSTSSDSYEIIYVQGNSGGAAPQAPAPAPAPQPTYVQPQPVVQQQPVVYQQTTTPIIQYQDPAAGYYTQPAPVPQQQQYSAPKQTKKCEVFLFCLVDLGS